MDSCRSTVVHVYLNKHDRRTNVLPILTIFFFLFFLFLLFHAAGCRQTGRPPIWSQLARNATIDEREGDRATERLTFTFPEFDDGFVGWRRSLMIRAIIVPAISISLPPLSPSQRKHKNSRDFRMSVSQDYDFDDVAVQNIWCRK